MSHRAFMEQVGFLSYAVIAVDGSPDERELRRVTAHISEKAKPVTGPEQEQDSADWLIALVAFKEAARTLKKPSVLVREFERFVDSPAFRHTGSGLRREAFDVLRYAAASLNGTDSVESALLQRLKAKL